MNELILWTYSNFELCFKWLNILMWRLSSSFIRKFPNIALCWNGMYLMDLLYLWSCDPFISIIMPIQVLPAFGLYMFPGTNIGFIFVGSYLNNFFRDNSILWFGWDSCVVFHYSLDVISVNHCDKSSIFLVIWHHLLGRECMSLWLKEDDFQTKKVRSNSVFVFRSA